MKLFLDYFDEVVKENPEKIAYYDLSGTRTTTYKELDDISSRIAQYLLNKGIKKGDMIPILIPRRMEYIAAILGIQKAGGAFVNLISDYPKDRIDYIIEDLKAPFILDLESVNEALKEEPLKEYIPLEPDDAAYALYTSGSTGNPKGILHTQKSMIANTFREIENEELVPDDIRLNTASLSFSASL